MTTLDDETIKCSCCGEMKPANEFTWKHKERNQRVSYCRPCRAAYGQEHYLANRERYIAQSHARKQKLFRERTGWLFEYFADHPCVDCGESDPIVLEFDHLRDKEFDIGPGMPVRAWASILAEIERCEVVCANCHRRRTAMRRRSFRYRVLLGEED